MSIQVVDHTDLDEQGQPAVIEIDTTASEVEFVPADTFDLQIASLRNFAFQLGYELEDTTFVISEELRSNEGGAPEILKGFQRISFVNMLRMHNKTYLFSVTKNGQEIPMATFKLKPGTYFRVPAQIFWAASSVRLIEKVKLRVSGGEIVADDHSVSSFIPLPEFNNFAKLKYDAVLENWYTLPGGRIVGKIYNDRKGRFKNGQEVTTSVVAGSDQEIFDLVVQEGVIVYTKNTAYLLGEQSY